MCEGIYALGQCTPVTLHTALLHHSLGLSNVPAMNGRSGGADANHTVCGNAANRCQSYSSTRRVVGVCASRPAIHGGTEYLCNNAPYTISQPVPASAVLA